MKKFDFLVESMGFKLYLLHLLENDSQLNMLSFYYTTIGKNSLHLVSSINRNKVLLLIEDNKPFPTLIIIKLQENGNFCSYFLYIK